MANVMFIQEPEKQKPAKPSMHAFLELGFRPLYIAGCAWALISVALWVFAPQWLNMHMGALAWHAHEMLWGFIATIAVGFLLTASATWTGLNPMKGTPLAVLALLWAMARLLYLFSEPILFILAGAVETLFFLSTFIALWRVINRTRNRRNYGLPWLALGLGMANVLYLYAAWHHDYAALMHYFTIGLIGMAIIALLVARRVIPFFAMRALPGLSLPMLTGWGQAQLGLGLLAIATGLVNLPRLTALLLASAGLISLYQVIRWKPGAILSKPILWILYLGYAFLGLGLVVAGLWLAGWTPNVLSRTALPAHVIGMGGFALLIIGMVTRTALGHLGRPLKLDHSMIASYWLMVFAVVLRMTALWPSPLALFLVHAAAACWVLSLALYLWRFVPMLIRPRPNAIP
ncbi:NnrS family protein [Pusillimonas sp. DMV24BSW_D]|uniref:NnrS family protein n=1 Tax=Neopusillimonas aestuarii TaxID=2716226 RepID=UPI001407F67D|nr:NnrS family protein [Pusillimonas sp. DMV24BSW_D]QIM48831.1 NnrS family protein [Pusillimonas sp. DMV24BSW_D]